MICDERRDSTAEGAGQDGNRQDGYRNGAGFGSKRSKRKQPDEKLEKKFAPSPLPDRAKLAEVLPVLDEERICIGWMYEQYSKGGVLEDKPRKVPDPHRSVTDISEHRTLREVKPGRGVGVVINHTDLWLIDLDNCRDPKTGVFEPWAHRFVDRCSCVQVSSSGKGAHCIYRLPNDVWDGGENLTPIGADTTQDKRRIEVYGAHCKNRFIALTGVFLPGKDAPPEELELWQAEELLAGWEDRKRRKRDPEQEERLKAFCGDLDALARTLPACPECSEELEARAEELDAIEDKGPCEVGGKAYPSRSEARLGILVEAARELRDPDLVAAWACMVLPTWYRGRSNPAREVMKEARLAFQLADPSSLDDIADIHPDTDDGAELHEREETMNGAEHRTRPVGDGVWRDEYAPDVGAPWDNPDYQPAGLDDLPELDEPELDEPEAEEHGQEARGSTGDGSASTEDDEHEKASRAYQERKQQREEAKQEKSKKKTADYWRSLAQDGTRASNIEPTKWALKGMMAQSKVAAIVAAPKQGKSAIALTIHLHLSQGMDFAGHKCMTGAKCVYIAMESVDTLRKQMKAFRLHHGLVELPNFYFFDRKVDFGDEDGLVGLAEFLKEEGVTHIVVDTLVHVVSQMGGDENKAADMKRALETIRKIAGPAAVMILHHGTKADPENARGSGVLAGDVDDLFVIRTPRRDDEEKAADVDGVELDEDEEVPAPIQGCRQLRLFHKVHREAQCPTINLTMMPIEIGTDEDGDPDVSIVIVPDTADRDRQRRQDDLIRLWLDNDHHLDGQKVSVRELAKRLGMPRSSLQRRIEAIEQARQRQQAQGVEDLKFADGL